MILSLSILLAVLFLLLMVAVWSNIQLRQSLGESKRTLSQMQCEIAEFVRSARLANEAASKSQFVRMFP